MEHIFRTEHRYSIAISDNSGMNLADERVSWRITLQKLTAGVFLLWPSALVQFSLIWTVYTAEYLAAQDRWIYGGLASILVLFVQAVLCELFFRKFGKGFSGNPRRTIFGHRSLPINEQTWLSKLIGIYNDYLFTLPKTTNFKGIYKKTFEKFTALYVTNTFPRADFSKRSGSNFQE